ncbi:hypothetical protein GGR92_005282 [Spirosoma lacussanchae]|uniref:hypothetical protein n=1 Tax=Spirosoma lacussanchae TaxID=1884249 RepID=UPI0011096D9D|nr:hypothetical protein [Spirosoma lacussanchae]
MKSNTISAEIARQDGRLISASIIMPTWHHRAEDGKLYAQIPFLGLETYGRNEERLNEAIKEAFICFCLLSERSGRGVEEELIAMGWQLDEPTSEGHAVLVAKPADELYDRVLQTGDERAYLVDMTAYHDQLNYLVAA